VGTGFRAQGLGFKDRGSSFSGALQLVEGEGAEFGSSPRARTFSLHESPVHTLDMGSAALTAKQLRPSGVGRRGVGFFCIPVLRQDFRRDDAGSRRALSSLHSTFQSLVFMSRLVLSRKPHHVVAPSTPPPLTSQPPVLTILPSPPRLGVRGRMARPGSHEATANRANDAKAAGAPGGVATRVKAAILSCECLQTLRICDLGRRI
jgi:hypothetical protein